MENFELVLTPAMLVIVPIVATILQTLKRIEAVEKITQWLPFASIGLSIGLCYLASIVNPIMAGIIVGLVASGGYDVLKGSVKKITK